jgi:hypothetical protein
MSSKSLLKCVRTLIPCALALLLAASAPAQEPPDRLYGEEPYEEPFVDNPSDDWRPSFVPNLIDLPAAELVERHHPTLEMTLQRRTFDYTFRTSIGDLTDAFRHDGVRFLFHVRLGRDFQLTMGALAVEPGFVPDGPDAFPATLGGALFEIKYLSPYEVVGIRTSAGFRVGVYDEKNGALFTYDDYTQLRSLYVTFGAYPRQDVRLHLTLMSVFAHSSPDLLFTASDYGLIGAGVEYTAWSKRANYVRLIGEVIDRKFQREVGSDAEAVFGVFKGAADAFANAMIRVRTGILQVDVATRHAGDSGWSENSITVVKRF